MGDEFSILFHIDCTERLALLQPHAHKIEESGQSLMMPKDGQLSNMLMYR